VDRKIVTTADGSKTIHIVDWNEHYHSVHGAIQEAYHVFIKSGLCLFRDRSISILEIGFGTGLNCFITSLEAQKLNLDIRYTGVEAYPITSKELEQLNYVSELKAENAEKQFKQMHQSQWEQEITLSNTFLLCKQQKDFKDLVDVDTFNLIYFDAFGARVQPELWTEAIFSKMYTALKNEGVLVTYSAKGSVRRAMKAAGFVVERLPGPPGKREMLRAIKYVS